jgi:hypothetical protein
MFNYTMEFSLLQSTQLFLITETDILEMYIHPVILTVNTASLLFSLFPVIKKPD